MLKSTNLNPNSAKKRKIDPIKRIELPNEIWLQIIKNLPSKDVYGSLAFVNKRFNELCNESGVTKSIKVGRHYNLGKCIKVLKDSKTSIEIVYHNVYDNIIYEGFDEKVISESILLTEKLKSLKISFIPFNTFDTANQISMNLIENLMKSNSQLEHLEFKGIYVKPEIMFEISKIKTLKTLKIIDAKRVVFTPEVVNALAENDNQLETVDFDDIDYDIWDYEFFTCQFTNNFNIALNNFIQKKSSTLKYLRKITFECVGELCQHASLENLSLCHRVEEFCGYLTPQDIETLSGLPKLKRLQLQDLMKSPKFLLGNLNLAYLQYLKLDTYYPYYTLMENEIPLHYFPVLERLCIFSKVTDETLKTIISNAPKLKSIQYTKNPDTNVTNKTLYEICKDRNTIVVIGNIFINPRQRLFEKFLLEHDLVVFFGKYSKMKFDFLDWCENNPDYAYSTKN